MQGKCYVCDDKNENLAVVTIHENCLKQLTETVEKLEEPDICGNCRFFSEKTGDCTGTVYDECRKKSPEHGCFPETEKNKWCGDFEKKGINNHEK